MLAKSTWNIGLNAWIIQDGNYPDFATGQTVEFAVQFYQQPAACVQPCESDVDAHLVAETTYDVVAETVLAIESVTVLGIGILVYREESKLPVGNTRKRFRTKLDLGVDPFDYFERLAKRDSIPAMIYSWRINSILRQTAPLIETGSRALGKVMMRDDSKLGYEEIPRTEAWDDDGGYADYILSCELLPIPAKRRSRTAL